MVFVHILVTEGDVYCFDWSHLSSPGRRGNTSSVFRCRCSVFAAYVHATVLADTDNSLVLCAAQSYH